VPGGTTVKPSGFSRSEAIFATNFTGARPAEQTRPVSSRMRALMPRRVSTGGPKSSSVPLRSRKASSRLSGCTRGVYSRRMAMMRLLSAT